MIPLKTQAIADALGLYKNTRQVDVDVFVEFPSDTTTTSEGLYVARFHTEQRQNVSLTLHNSGSIYDVVDRLELYLIQGQLNPTTDDVLNLMDDFVDDSMFVQAGYIKREYTVEQVFRKNNECYRIIVSLTRIKTLN